MRLSILAPVVVLAMLCGCRAPSSVQPEPPTAESPATAATPLATTTPEAATTEASRGSRGVAVVELFTSEGCSSCPPADEVLAELAAKASPGSAGGDVYPLAFHVDYWNSLGWTDRFSTSAFTERQQDYAASFRSRRVYTPQMIVNGVTEFTGSERGRARRAIDDALARRSVATVTLRIEGDDARAVRVAYAVEGAPPGSVLRLALVDREDASQVQSGENAGRTLRHARVVRTFETVDDPEKPGTRALGRPEASAYEVVGYVQSRTRGPDGGMPIVGAARVRR